MVDIGISEVVAGILGGALAGSLITIVGTTWLERLRWRREDKVRFDQQKLQACTRFLGLLDLERQTPKRTREEDLELRRNFTHAQAELMVLASPPVREAASAVFEAFLSEKPYAVVAQKREIFLAAAKEELGIPVPEQPLLSRVRNSLKQSR